MRNPFLNTLLWIGGLALAIGVILIFVGIAVSEQLFSTDPGTTQMSWGAIFVGVGLMFLAFCLHGAALTWKPTEVSD